ncbi:MAG: hypothetical protein R2851_28760 [Caldilineaceae bacterium]
MSDAGEAGEGGVSQPDASPQQSSSPGDNKGARKPVQIGDTFETKRLDTPLDKMTRERAGKRSYTRTDRKRGRYIKARPANDRRDDIAFDATLRAAAPFQRQRKEEAVNDLALQLRTGDLQRKIRVRRTGNLILFAVDASWSMAASEAHGGHQGRDLQPAGGRTEAPHFRWVWSSSSGTARLCCRRPVCGTGPEGAARHPRGRQDAAQLRPSYLSWQVIETAAADFRVAAAGCSSCSPTARATSA